MEIARWNIYWTEYASDTFIYGSEIQYHSKNYVEFINHLVPAGTVIKSWFSKTNYQAQRIEPSLPLIDGENTYEIITNITSEKPDTWLLRLVFLDRYEDEVGSLIIRDKRMVFKCPIKTYSYQIQLINGGAEVIHFHSITIREISDESEKRVSKV